MTTYQYSKDELWKLYEHLPSELKGAIFSEENANRTFSICERHNINDVSKVSYFIGLVLFGIIPIEDFQNVLVQEIGVKKDVAQRASRDFFRLIFYPVKPELDQLHQTSASSASGTVRTRPASKVAEATTPQGQQVTEEPSSDQEDFMEPDPYRETFGENEDDETL